MTGQLALIDDRAPDYRLDEHTREVGRRGVAAARQLLRQVPAPRVERPSWQRTPAA